VSAGERLMQLIANHHSEAITLQHLVMMAHGGLVWSLKSSQ
jgi:hypothetical protein